jgi:hypothetical protein
VPELGLKIKMVRYRENKNIYKESPKNKYYKVTILLDIQERFKKDINTLLILMF